MPRKEARLQENVLLKAVATTSLVDQLANHIGDAHRNHFLLRHVQILERDFAQMRVDQASQSSYRGWEM